MHASQSVAPYPRAISKHIHAPSLQTTFTTMDVLKAVKRSQYDVIEKGLYDEVRLYLSPEDLALAANVENLVFRNFYFQGLATDPFHDRLAQSSVGSQHEATGLLASLTQRPDIQAEALRYYQGTSNHGWQEPAYQVHRLGKVLVVGVAPGFGKSMEKSSDVKAFYANCLELCGHTIQGEEVRFSPLFAQFVKLSLSF